MLLVNLSVILLSICLLAISISAIYLATYAWWDPANRSSTSYPPALPELAFSFSLIMPCRRERESVMRETLQRLLDQTHPNIEVIISVGHDDPETVEIAHRLAAEHPTTVLVSVDYSPVKNKPRQLNTALEMCSNDIVGIFDAESIAAPELLRRIDSSFQTNEADVVQGAVQLVNYRDSWYALRNCLEYFIWFRSRLHAHAKYGFIPLGGNTVFVRRTLLVSVGGWDGDCLAEDCELGVRLSTLKRRIVVAYSPELVTREETPDSIKALVKQRTRWSLGFMQVYAKGEWKALPSFRERAIAWWTLTQQHLMAFTGVCIPISIAMIVIGGFPLAVTMISFLPLITTLSMVALEACMLHEFGKDHGFPIRARDQVRLVLGTPGYQLLLAFAALRALVRYYSDDFRWEKTEHTGAHIAYLEAR